MGKGGEISNPLPSRMVVNGLIEIEVKASIVGVSVQRCLPAGTIPEDKLRLPVKELLVVAIGAGSWSF